MCIGFVLVMYIWGIVRFVSKLWSGYESVSVIVGNGILAELYVKGGGCK